VKKKFNKEKKKHYQERNTHAKFYHLKNIIISAWIVVTHFFPAVHKAVRPRQVAATSIPGLLTVFQVIIFPPLHYVG
jgi:hypothetical protein